MILLKIVIYILCAIVFLLIIIMLSLDKMIRKLSDIYYKLIEGVKTK